MQAQLRKQGILLQASADGRYLISEGSEEDIANFLSSQDSNVGQDYFNLLCSLVADEKIIPLPYPFINADHKLPSWLSKKDIEILFQLGYAPSPKNFYHQVKDRIYDLASLYYQYVGIPWAPEEEREGGFIPYVYHSLDLIIKNILQLSYNEAKYGFSEGAKIGFKIVHGLHHLNANFKNGIFSFSRLHLSTLKNNVTFRLLDIPDEKNVMKGKGVNLNNVKIEITTFEEPLRELIPLRKMLSDENWNQLVFNRVMANDYTVDLADLTKELKFDVPTLVDNLHFYGPSYYYSKYINNLEANDRLGMKEMSVTTNIKEQVETVVSSLYDVENKNRINGLINCYSIMYNYKIAFSRENNTLSFKGDAITVIFGIRPNPKRKAHITITSLQGNLRSIVQLYDLFDGDDYTYNKFIFEGLVKKDNSVTIEDLVNKHNYNPRFSIIYTNQQAGTYAGSAIEVCGYFGLTDLANKLAPHCQSIIKKGYFGKSILNGKYRDARYNFPYHIAEEDKLRAAYYKL